MPERRCAHDVSVTGRSMGRVGMAREPLAHGGDVVPEHPFMGPAQPPGTYRQGMVRIGAIVLKVSDTGRAGEFWTQALGYRRGDNPDFLLPGDGGGPRLHLDETDRSHLDLWAANEAEQRAEVERLQALGASRVEWDYPDGADFVVLADPDANLFCVVNTDS